jgi:hypothetical protein
VRGGREASQVQSRLGDDRRRGGDADPGELIEKATPQAKGAIWALVRSSMSAMSARSWSMRASILVSRNAWCSLNLPMNASRGWGSSCASSVSPPVSRQIAWRR